MLGVWAPGCGLTCLLTSGHLLLVSKAFIQHRLCRVQATPPAGGEAERRGEGEGLRMVHAATVRTAAPGGGPLAGPPGPSPVPTAATVSLPSGPHHSAGRPVDSALGAGPLPGAVREGLGSEKGQGCAATALC